MKRKGLKFTNENIPTVLSLSPTTPRHTNTSPMITSALQPSIKSINRKRLSYQSKQQINDNGNRNMLLLTCENQTNNSFRQSRSNTKAKQKKITNRKNARQQPAKKVLKQKSKLMNNKRSSQSNKNKQKRTQSSANQKKSPSSTTKRSRNSSHTHSSRQQQSKTIQSAQKRKKARKKSSPITATSSSQSQSEPEAKQHHFKNRDRTTSLMALQTLAEKIALYKKKYGDIETRHSSIIAPPKAYKKQKQRKK